MRLLTRQTIANDIVEFYLSYGDYLNIADGLRALGENPDPDKVDALFEIKRGKELTKQILGTCDECNKFYETLCELDVVYGERFAICVDCARAAYEKFSKS